jgi:hypothetical protein
MELKVKAQFQTATDVCKAQDLMTEVFALSDIASMLLDIPWTEWTLEINANWDITEARRLSITSHYEIGPIFASCHMAPWKPRVWWIVHS